MPIKKPKLIDFPYFCDQYDLDDFNSNIEVEYLKAGCKEPDCIPSIDYPKWIGLTDAIQKFDEKEEVLVLFDIIENEINELYVFPITILDYHEIVNFSFSDNIPVAITYCPLCQTSTAYIRKIDDDEIELGVSGLLYNSALIMYDRFSQSLFSQIYSEGIHGKYNKNELTKLPLLQTNLDALNESDYKINVLSDQTGYPKKERMYGRYPYRDYKESDKIYYPTKEFDDKLGSKELVYKLDLKKQILLIPKSILSNSQQRISENVVSLPFMGSHLFFSNPQEQINWEDWIPADLSFYFAIKAYYPESKLITEL